MFYFLLSVPATPLSLDGDDGKPRTRDGARGRPTFPLPPLDDINKNEIRKAVNSEKCENYTNHTCHSLLGKMSPLRGPRNCFAKAIEDSLKPTCDLEKQYLEALEYYEDERDDTAVEEIEEALLALEEQKYYITDELYLIADEFDALEQDTIGKIDEREDRESNVNFMEGLLYGGQRIFVRTELGSFTRCLDSRARQICLSIDFSKVKKRRR